MRSLRMVVLILLGVGFCTSLLASQPRRALTVTSVTVTAYEYRDYYGLPDTERWRKVESIKIEGQNRSGNISAVQSGPAELLEVTLYDVAVGSEYTTTVTWQGGGELYETYVGRAQKETTHQFYEP